MNQEINHPNKNDKHNIYITTIYYLLYELEFLSDAEHVKMAWRGEIEGILTWPEDGYYDVHSFENLAKSVDYFLHNYSEYEDFKNFIFYFDNMMDQENSENSNYIDIEKYIISDSFNCLVFSAKKMLLSLSLALEEENIDIKRMHSEAYP